MIGLQQWDQYYISFVGNNCFPIEMVSDFDQNNITVHLTIYLGTIDISHPNRLDLPLSLKDRQDLHFFVVRRRGLD
jgi:hypothetical protein